MKLFLNGLAASAGGGLTYLRNVIPLLGGMPGVEAAVLLNPGLRPEFAGLSNISFLEAPDIPNAFRRFVHEQTKLPGLIRASGAQMLISAGNFALWYSPVPQILLSRNSLYTSADFVRDVRARGDYAIWADTGIKSWLARQSVRRAEVTVAPSEAFAGELTEWSGKKVVPVHHGFDPVAFTSDPTPLPAATQRLLVEGDDALRLLFVSHYNYYRNFEVLLRAIPRLKQLLPARKIKLYLTCRLDSRQNPGAYKAETASSLAADLRAQHEIVELGAIPYRSLHHLYRACNIYVTPAYAESFAHPLVEAMSSGLPIVASDLPVHREICRDAAVYFPRFSPDALAERISELSCSPALAETLGRKGQARTRDFSWSGHVKSLLALAQSLVSATPHN